MKVLSRTEMDLIMGLDALLCFKLIVLKKKVIRGLQLQGFEHLNTISQLFFSLSRVSFYSLAINLMKQEFNMSVLTDC